MKQQLLQVGDTAPLFKTTDVLGRHVDLSSCKDPFVLMVFLRYAGCPWCNLAVHRLALEYPLLKRDGCEVIAFVQSDKKNVLANIYGRHSLQPPFSIVADNDRIFYDLYKVQSSMMAVARSIRKVPYWLQATFHHGFRQAEVDGDLFLVPALFVVNTRTGKIVGSEYGKSFYDHDTFTTIYEQLVFERI